MSTHVFSHAFRISILALTLLLCPAGQAAAQPLSAVAKRNYNRALRTEQAGDMDAARGYWAEADQGWSAWLTEHGQARALTDKLVMAGISFYKNGRPEAAIQILERAREQDPYRFEPYVFQGLARAALGQGEDALAAWQAAPPGAVDMKLAPVLVEQRQALAEGRASLAEAAQAIEDKCRELTKEIMLTDKPVDPFRFDKEDSDQWDGGAWGQ